MITKSGQEPVLWRDPVTAVADSRGRAVAFHLAPGQAHELPGAPALLSRLPDAPAWVVADRGYL